MQRSLRTSGGRCDPTAPAREFIPNSLPSFPPVTFWGSLRSQPLGSQRAKGLFECACGGPPQGQGIGHQVFNECIIEFNPLTVLQSGRLHSTGETEAQGESLIYPSHTASFGGSQCCALQCCGAWTRGQADHSQHKRFAKY